MRRRSNFTLVCCFHKVFWFQMSIIIQCICIYLIILKQWLCDTVFVIVNFNSVCFFLFSSYCLILHSWWIKPYILLMSKTVSLQNNRWQRRSYYSPFGSVPWICHTLLWTGCYVSGCDQKTSRSDCISSECKHSYHVLTEVHCVSHYNFNAHQPILVIFGSDVAERVCYQMVICYPTSPNWCLCTTWGNINMNPGNCVFSVMLYTVSWKRHFFSLLYLWHSSTNFNNFL